MTTCDVPKRNDENELEFPLIALYINPTRYCNLLCSHCWVTPPTEGKSGVDAGEISPEEMIDMISVARPLGLTSIKLTGGEPLLRNDLEGLLKYCHQLDIEVFLETNGTLITEDVAVTLSKYKVHSISVSIDSASGEAHDRLRGQKGAFERTIRGIRNLAREGIHPQVIMTLYRENLDSFRAFTGLMKELEVSDIKVNIISPLGRGARLKGEGIAPTIKEVLDFYEKTEDMKGAYTGDIYVDIPPTFQKIERIKSRGFSRCAIKGILGILADGCVSMCGVGYMNRDLVFGNAKKDPSVIKDIWQNNPVVREIREDLPVKLEGVCGKCVFRKTCLGGCRAEVYHNKGSITAPSWFCQEAYEEGFFPETRIVPRGLRV